MNRPKRAAAQKPRQEPKLKDLGLSDLEDEESDDGDFSSQSSDDFDPGVQDNKESEEDDIASEHSDGSGEDEKESSPEKDKTTYVSINS